MTIVELRAFILRKLGYPIHNVELTTEQIDDAIYEAVDRFTERHYDAIIAGLYKLTIIPGQNSYTLPNSIKSVVMVYPGNNIFSSMSGMENMLIPVLPMPYQDYLWKLNDISSIMSWRMAVKQWEDAVSNQNIIYDFNYTMHKITFMGDMNRLLQLYPNTNGFYLQVFEAPDTDEDTPGLNEDILNNRWLKNFSVALSKRQWATNLKKFNGVPLPGGGDLNHDGIMADANEEIERLEIQLEDEFVLPPSFIVG